MVAPRIEYTLQLTPIVLCQPGIEKTQLGPACSFILGCCGFGRKLHLVFLQVATVQAVLFDCKMHLVVDCKLHLIFDRKSHLVFDCTLHLVFIFDPN